MQFLHVLSQVMFASDLPNFGELLNNEIPLPVRDFPQANNEEQQHQYHLHKGHCESWTTSSLHLKHPQTTSAIM